MMTKKEIEEDYAKTDALIRASLEEERFFYEQAERERTEDHTNLSNNWNFAKNLSDDYFRRHPS
jgi:hypothetical protein